MTSLKSLVQETGAILLDFDGPVCRLFSAVPAPEIAEKIRSLLRERSVNVPESMKTAGDPLVLLRWTGKAVPRLLPEVERLQVESEIRAARLARPTHGAAELIRSSAAQGRPVVIVTNNSTEAVETYLDRLSLTVYVSGISARIPGRPDLMKPDPHLVLKGAEIAGKPTSSCVLIGDSPTDIHAAQKAGTRSIGYAKTDTRVSELSEAGADVVLRSMSPVADVMTRLER